MLHALTTLVPVAKCRLWLMVSWIQRMMVWSSATIASLWACTKLITDHVAMMGWAEIEYLKFIRK